MHLFRIPVAVPRTSSARMPRRATGSRNPLAAAALSACTTRRHPRAQTVAQPHGCANCYPTEGGMGQPHLSNYSLIPN